LKVFFVQLSREERTVGGGGIEGWKEIGRNGMCWL
jgi:hypothetical protein